MTNGIRVAALYTLPKSSPYQTIAGVDCWPEERNALLYRGPYPVIAHPPCAPWSRAVAHQVKICSAQGPHLAPIAVTQVQEFGGILEQPARSRLWDVMSLPHPEAGRQMSLSGPEADSYGGWTMAVLQGDFGHNAPKKTWLYMVGIDPGSVVMPPPAPAGQRSARIRTDKRTGRRWYRSEYDMRSPEARKRTPLAFAEWLVELAAGAQRPASVNSFEKVETGNGS